LLIKGGKDTEQRAESKEQSPSRGKALRRPKKGSLLRAEKRFGDQRRAVSFARKSATATKEGQSSSREIALTDE